MIFMDPHRIVYGNSGKKLQERVREAEAEILLKFKDSPTFSQAAQNFGEAFLLRLEVIDVYDAGLYKKDERVPMISGRFIVDLARGAYNSTLGRVVSSFRDR